MDFPLNVLDLQSHQMRRFNYSGVGDKKKTLMLEAHD
jgi:hypothetical protein